MASVDVVTASGAADVDIYADDVSMYLSGFCEFVGVDNPKDLSSMQWAGALRYIADHVYKNSGVLKKSSGINNAYDIDKVSKLCDLYISMCYTYGQRVCLEHFSHLSGIDFDCLYSWKNARYQGYIYLDSNNNVIDISNHNAAYINTLRKVPTKTAQDIYKRLVQNTVSAADDIMLSRSGVNSIAYRNAIQERYAARQDTGVGAVDVVGLADQLGISGDIRGLIGADSTKNQ